MHTMQPLRQSMQQTVQPMLHNLQWMLLMLQPSLLKKHAMLLMLQLLLLKNSQPRYQP